MSQATTQEFGKWRTRFWPIHGWELKKVVPMMLMCFLILFNYTILRDIKDVLIVGGCSAAAIPFIKFWGTVPMAVVFMVLYSKMSNILSKPGLFYAAILPFAVFFPVFAYILYPNFHAIAPHALADWLVGNLPANLAVLGEVARSWPFAIFYIFAELWGSVALSLLFWGFANDVTGVTEAKRAYPVFTLFGNLALVVSGEVIIHCSGLGSGEDRAAFGTTLNYLMGVVTLGIGVVVGLYAYLQAKVLKDPKFLPAADQKKKKKEKPKMGLMESFAYLAKSKYILCLAILVLGYGISINLVEVTWKGQLKLQYPAMVDYMRFMGKFSRATGYFSIAMILLISGNFIRRFGWGPSAIFTPVVLLITGLGFFAFILFKGSLGGLVAMFGATPLFFGVIFGAIQNIFSKSSKYSLFDPTKEMAYIPLDQEQKVKGKAAIDVVGARLGKSGGSIIQQFLIAVVGFGAIVPYVAAIVTVVIVGWIIAAGSLSRQFAKLSAQRAQEAIEAAEEARAETEAQVAPAAS
ncbi:MAG: Npt1/Npt2 family nucleotide transporter [Parachlamydiales bacterium]